MTAEHRVPLGDTGWWVWRDVLVRSTGFPSDGVDRFAAPDCARAADALLAADEVALADKALLDKEFDKEFDAAQAVGAQVCDELAADPRLREAISWQSASARAALDGLLRPGSARRRNNKRRERETLVARYWQRYCVKNETIGFFGPAAWATIDPQAPSLTARPGQEVIRDRVVELEHWVLAAYAHAIAEDPAVRRWLPPSLPPHLTVDKAGRRVLRPAHGPVPLSPAEVTALSLSDGRRQAVAVVAELIAGDVVLNDDDGYLLLERLADRGLLNWRGDLPIGPDAEPVLRALLAGIGDEATRAAATAGLDRLAAARDEVAAAAGEADRVTAALAKLAEEFTAATGEPAHRRAGEMYAGRGTCFEETTRDLDVVIGGPLLAELATPLSLLLGAARWLTAELATAYRAALHELYDELSAEGDVRLADLWYLAQGALFGTGERPVDTVAREFVRRWSVLFGLDAASAGAMHFTAAELAPAAAAAFPADRPGWSAGRLHSPDLQICAEDTAAVERGDYLVVLGELHAAWPTFDAAVFTRWHSDPEELRRALAADLGEHRIRPLYPADWPRYTGRVAPTLDGPTDRQLGFTDAPGADPDRLLPATSVLVTPGEDGELVARAPDGRRWPLVEMFSALLAMHSVDGFKLVGAGPHTPRITVDKLVVVRETWRTTIEETGLADMVGWRDRYLAVRQWRRRLGLPERVFVKLAAETKPVFVDLTSPVYAAWLCSMLRGAMVAGRAGAVTISEVLPDTGQHWLTDAAGNRYSSELRLQIVDPMEPR